MAAGREGRFHAFISYSRANQPTVRRLHRELSRMFHPVFRGPKLDLYRDRENLSAGGELGTKLEDALDRSDHLILAVSPSASASEWVDAEVDYWVKSRPETKPIVVVATLGDTEITEEHWLATVQPPSLVGAELRDPIWLDIRYLNDRFWRLKTSPSHHRETMASLVDAIDDDRTKPELIGAERKRQRRLVASGLLLGSLLVLSVVAGLVFQQSSSRNATARESIELATAASADIRPDVALLLAAQSYRIDPTAEAIDALGNMLAGEPGVVGFLQNDGEPILASAVDTTDQALLTVTANGNVTSWSLADGTASTEPIGTGVRAAAFTGTELITVADGALQYRELSDVAEVVDSVAIDGEVATMAAATDGAVIVGTVGGRVLTHNRSGGPLVEIGRHDGQVRGVAITDDASMAASTGDDGRAAVLDLKTGESFDLQSGLATGADSPSDVAISADGAQIAIASFAGGVTIWDVPSRQPLRTLFEDEIGFISALRFSAEGRHLMAGGSEGEVAAWDVVRAEPVEWRSLAHRSPVTDLRSMSGTSLFVSTSTDGSIAFWDVVGRSSLAFPLNAAGALDRDPASETLLLITPGGELNAVGPEGDLLWNWEDLSIPIGAVAVADAETVIVGLADGSLARLDLENGGLLEREVLLPEGPLFDVVVEPGSGLVVALGWDSRLVAVTPSSLAPAWSVQLDLPGANRIRPTPGGDLLVYGTDEPFVVAVSASTGELTPTDERDAVGFARDADVVARVDSSGEPVLLVSGGDVDGGPHRLPLPITAEEYDVAVSPDGSLVAAMTTEGEVSVWTVDPPSRLVPARRVHVRRSLPRVRFLDNDFFYSADLNVVMAWNIDPATWPGIACGRVGRVLVARESVGLRTDDFEWCDPTTSDPIGWWNGAPVVHEGFDELELSEWAVEHRVGALLDEADRLHLSMLDAMASPQAERASRCTELAADDALALWRQAFAVARTQPVFESGLRVVEALDLALAACVDGDGVRMQAASTLYLQSQAELWGLLGAGHIALGPAS